MNRLAFVPMAIPSIVVGLAFMFVYLTLPIPIYGTIWIIALAMVTKYIAFSSGAMMAAQMQISKELEEASQIAGQGWAKTYRRITLPLLGGAVFNCFLWVVVHAIRELAVSIMLYSPDTQVLSTEVWSLWEGGRVAQASALGVLVAVFLALLMGLPACARGLRAASGRLRSPRAAAWQGQ
jgi:iron(III) transport system permease protein